MAWLSGWEYRKDITLARASGLVTNYQMKLLVGESSGATGENVDCGGKCLSTFNDLRFTKADGITILDYWIESISGTTPNQLATVWIEFDSIGTSDTTFYMYYGNSGAPAISNGDNTFLIFDDFNDGSLDGAKWSVKQGDVTETGGNLVLTGTTGTRGIIESITGLTQGAAVEVRARSESSDSFGNCHFCSIRQAGDWNDKGADLYGSAANKGMFSTAVSGVPTTIEVYLTDCSTFSKYKITWLENEAKLCQTDILLETITTNVAAGTQYITFYEANTSGSNAYIDYVFARQFVATEPTWGSWGAEEYDGSFTTESAVASATMDGIIPIESTTESAEATDTFDGDSLRDSFTESAEASDTFGSEKTAYGVTTESAEAEDTMAYLHMVDSFTDSAVASDSMEAAEMIRKRIRFPNLQGKHLSLKFTSATDGSFAIYYLRHKMFKTRELCSDQKHPNTQGSHIGIKLSNSGSDEFILMYVSEKMQLVTT